MKKVLALALALMMLFGAASALAAPKVGIVIPDADHGFTGESIAQARMEIEALASELGIEYKLEVGGEAAKQIAAVETILTWNPDAIMLWPLEGEQLRNAAHTVVDQGVKLVVYDRLIEGFEGLTAEIMGDNESIGKMMGEYILEYFAEELKAGEELTYLTFFGDSSTVTSQRDSGFRSVIDASEYAAQFVQVQEPFQTDWSNAKAQEQMENWLNTADPEMVKGLDFIATHDDEIADGLSQALAGFGGEQNIRLITGIGGRRETLDLYAGKDVDFVTYFFSPSFIREAVRLTVAAASGETYQDQEIAGQLFLIDSFQIRMEDVEEYKASVEYAERYAEAE